MGQYPPKEEDAKKVWLFMNAAKFDYKRHVVGEWQQLKHVPWNEDPDNPQPKRGTYTFHRLKLVDMDLISEADPIEKILPGKDAITIKMLHATTEKGVHAILQTGRIKAMPYQKTDSSADDPEVNHTVVYGQGSRMEIGEENSESNGREMSRIANKASFSGHNCTGIAFEMQASGHHKPLKKGGADGEQLAIKENDNAVCSMNGRWSVHEHNQSISAIWIISQVICSHRHSTTKKFTDDIYLG
jgi:hypothetical protein